MSDHLVEEIYERHWLNDDKGTAYIVLEMAYEKDYRTEDGRNGDVDIEIKDCNRQCRLEFGYYNAKTYEQRKAKIRHLIEQLQKVEDFILKNPYVEGVIKKDIDAKDELKELTRRLDPYASGVLDDAIILPAPEDKDDTAGR